MSPATTVHLLDPKFLGFWTRCIRETSHWSQEALAASSGLDVRTIQRIEAGKSVNVTTRRALARGLGYDNSDVFDDPAFIKFMHEFLKDIKEIQDEATQKQFPDHVRLVAAKVSSGEALVRFVCNSEGYVFNSDDAIVPKAKEVAASMFDYLQDLGDISDDASFSEKLIFHRELDDMLKEIEELGATCYSAVRAAKIVGTSGAAPITFKAGYLVVVPKEKSLKEMIVPRHFQ